MDIELVPVTSPFDALKGFTCRDVPYSLNRSSCNITYGDDCVTSEYSLLFSWRRESWSDLKFFDLI